MADVTNLRSPAEAGLSKLFESSRKAFASDQAISREEAFRFFEATGLPSRRVEAFKYTDLRAAITEAAMRGELDFAGALDARMALLKGLDAGAIDRCRAERVRLTPGARTLVRTMRARGAATVLVSGGFTAFAEPVGAEIGFDTVIANRLEIDGESLAGTVGKPIVDAGTKLATLERVRDELGLPVEATLAVGDGANDLPMIQAAGLGVAYHAKPVVAAAAAARIDHGDLTALLWAQGIPRAQWVFD